MDYRSTDLYESAQKALSAGSYQRAIDLARHSLKLSRTEKEQTRSINLLSHVYYYVKAPRACVNLIDSYSGSISSELFNVLEQRKKTCIELLRFIDEANKLVGVVGSMPNMFIDIAEDLNIAVVGDSHVSSFSQALFPCRVVQTSPPLRGSDSRLAQALADLDNYNYILLSICGNMHTILSLSPDFRDPGNRNRSYLKSEITDYFVRAICFAIYPILDYIKLRTSVNKVTCLMAPPPPKKYKDLISFVPEDLDHETTLISGMFNPHESDYLESWSLFTFALMACARVFDMAYLHCPPGCQDNSQFLLKEFHRDLTHANSIYADLVCDSIRDNSVYAAQLLQSL